VRQQQHERIQLCLFINTYSIYSRELAIHLIFFFGGLFKVNKKRIHSCPTWCGYKAPGMVSLQAYVYLYNLLRGFIFEVLPLSSYALIPTMLPLLETFFKLVLWKSHI